MSRKVDHEQRKREVVGKAIRLFSQVGYDNVSLQMVAAAAGVSRTVLYRYFCSKREVLEAAIGAITGVIERRCAEIMLSRDTNTRKLEGVCHTVVDVMFENKEFLVAVFDYVVGTIRSGADMNRVIRRFTSGTRQALIRLIRQAIRKGEIIDELVVDRVADTLYSQFESCAMRIVLGTESDSRAAKVRFSDIVRALSIWH